MRSSVPTQIVYKKDLVKEKIFRQTNCFRTNCIFLDQNNFCEKNAAQYRMQPVNYCKKNE